MNDLPSRSPEVVSDNSVFKPPFLGDRIIKGMPLDDVAAYINETALFRNQWGYRPEKGEGDENFRTRIRLEFNKQLNQYKTKNILIPGVVYGYFCANSDGDDLIIWQDETAEKEIMRFTFPRQKKAPFLCVADFFRSKASRELDYAAFSIVTMGEAASQEAGRLFKANEYNQYLHLHGLSVEMAEALAEYFHQRIRGEWGFADEDDPSIRGLLRQRYRGGRYSWGYPACPSLEDNAKVSELLKADRLGIHVGEETSWQFQPEQTTSALICHHPQAKYFIAG